MGARQLIKNLIIVAFSNGVKLLSSILISLIIPKIFNMHDYAYYKVFILYLSYFGLFHFGFIDGIYLYYGNKDYNQLPKQKFRLYTKFLLVLELSISFIIIMISVIFLNGDRLIIFILLALNLVALNLTAYFQFISQITGRFKEFSSRNIIFSILTIIIVLIFYLFEISYYGYLVISIIGINYILLLWYLYTYKDITFGKSESFKVVKNEIVKLFVIGFTLMLSNLLLIIMLNLSKQFVDIFMSLEDFAIFSFSFSLMGFTAIFINAMSVVIYPVLRRMNGKRLINLYNTNNAIILIFVFIAVLSYYPLDVFVRWFLPDYVSSLKILFVLFPGLAIQSSIIIVKHNYYKTLSMNKKFLYILVITLILTIGINTLVTIFHRELLLYAVAYIFSVFVWSIVLDYSLQKIHHINILKNIIFIILASMNFYISSIFHNALYSSIYYFVSILIIILIFYKSVIKQYFNLYYNNVSDTKRM